MARMMRPASGSFSTALFQRAYCFQYFTALFVFRYELFHGRFYPFPYGQHFAATARRLFGEHYPLAAAVFFTTAGLYHALFFEIGDQLADGGVGYFQLVEISMRVSWLLLCNR